MKKYKKYKVLTLFVLLAITLTNCDEFEFGNSFLEQPPELKYSLDSAFVNAERAREVLWNAYSTLPYGHGYGKDNEGGGIGWIAYKSGVGNTNAYQVPLWCFTDLVRFRMTEERFQNG